jgi:prepilin-type N-terminal cleavage/methylation domain-containing protein
MKNNEKGFTLIELLVVIAILGLLTTIALVSLGGARSKARDARRLSDVKQMQTALELYYNASSTYPTVADLTTDPYFATSSLMKIIPTDPGVSDVSGFANCGGTAYTYSSTSGSTYTLKYCLSAATSGAKQGLNIATPASISE